MEILLRTPLHNLVRKKTEKWEARRFLCKLMFSSPSFHLDVDKINIKIINALVNNPYTKSKELSRSQAVPLSTIQRRRTILERTILTKQYTVNLQEFGWRTGDIFVSVEKAESDEVAHELLSDANVISTTTRVGDLDVNVSARVYYKS